MTYNTIPDGTKARAADARISVPPGAMIPPMQEQYTEQVLAQNGTMETASARELGLRLRQAMNLPIGDPRRMEFAEIAHVWGSEPWRALPFLRTSLGLQSPMLSELARWESLAANQGIGSDHIQKLWQSSTNPADVALRSRWQKLHGDLLLYLQTQSTTLDHLRSDRKARSTNFLEKAGSDFWQYAWEDMADHPVTSGALLVGGTMFAYSLFLGNFGKTRLGKAVKWGAGLTVLYSFLRDRYGFQLVEDVFASPLEKWGAPGAAKWIRDFRDTLTYPFRNREKQGSAFSYLARKLEVKDDDETTMLSAMLAMTPGNFLKAYNDANTIGTPNAQVKLPPEVRTVLNQMRGNQTISAKMDSYDDTEKVRLFKSVADKFLDKMPAGNRVQALSLLRDRMVTGRYYKRVSSEARYEKDDQGREHPIVSASVVRDGVPAMEKAVKTANANGSITMLDVAITHIIDEKDWSAMATYSPEAAAAKDLLTASQNAARAAYETAADITKGAYNFFTGDVPRYWNEYVWPQLAKAGPVLGTVIDELKAVGKAGSDAIVSFGENTAVGQVMRTTLGWTKDQLKEGYRITANSAHQLAVFLEKKRLLSNIDSVAYNTWEDTFIAAASAPLDSEATYTFSGNLKLWKSIHDLGIATIENRSSLETGRADADAVMKGEQAKRLLDWVLLNRKMEGK